MILISFIYIIPSKLIYADGTSVLSYLNVRFMLPALIFLIPAIEWEFENKIKSLICFFIIFLSIFAIVDVNSQFQFQSNEITKFVSGVDQININSNILTLVIECENCNTINPLMHSWGYYLINKGGLSPYQFKVNELYLISTKYDRLEAPSAYLPENYDSKKHAKK